MKNILLLTLIGLIFSACSSNKPAADEKAEEKSAEPVVEQIAEAPSVFFKHPADGATVPSPVFIEMGVTGMQVEPAGEVKEGFGHHHILINQSSWPKGEIIPPSDTTIHFGKGQTDTTLELDAGEYVLSLQFADGVHTSYGEEMAASIKITVE